MKLRIATCKALPERDVDAEPLAAALARGGFDAMLVPWEDPAAWSGPTATVIRSTWNYALEVDTYLAWIDHVSAQGPLFNPAAVVKANVHKRYLLALAARGLPVVPTRLVERGRAAAEGAAAIAAAGGAGATRIVIKPEVGAGSLGTQVFAVGDAAAAAHLADLTTRGAALVQPYLPSVEAYGERSLVWIDGALSHAIRKAPRFAGDAEQVEGPFAIADDERAIAETALASFGDLLYGRVDLARDAAGTPCIMELELVEPSLFFAHQPGSADRFVAGLARRLQPS